MFARSFALACAALLTLQVQSQVPSCGTNVPFYQVNLSGNPAGSWTSPGHSRDGNCCGTTPPDRCTSFEIILDTGAAMVSFSIASGAIPTGVMFYQISCGPPTPVGQPICVTGPGPHYLTFCKPGNNQNTYLITSIPKPTFPPDQYVRVGCTQSVTVLGFDTGSVTWNSVFPGNPGDYNPWLSCTTACTSPDYTPGPTPPPYIDYRVCGFPTADECGYVAMCDTIRIYNLPALSGSASPLNATFCANGPGVLLTASASGGDGNYSFIWRDQSSNIVSTSPTYLANTAQIFTVEIRDGLYDATNCPAVFLSVPVTITMPPVVNAGADQVVCRTAPTTVITGTIQYATGGVWSGGSGTYSPSNTNLIMAYTPTAGELTAGSVTLILTSTGAGGGCVNTSDTVRIYYPSLLTVNLGSVNLPCNASQVTLTPGVNGGISPYSYQWSTGATTNSITVGQGAYCVTITDNIGCTASVCATVNTPTPLGLGMSTTDVTINGGNDGTATATPSGGTAPYTYLWTPTGQTTQTATGLVYGVYSVTVTDANGCTIVSSVVVNEPRCLSFSVTATSGSLSCFGDVNGTSTATASGGTAPYTYVWNPSGQTNAIATGLSAGVYQVTVTDAGGCIDIAAIIITEPPQLVNNITFNNATTIGGNEGNATANPAGGTPGYTYLWSTGATTQNITGLTSGTYTITVTDANGCTAVNTVFIAEPPCNNLILGAVSTALTCNGSGDGSATAFAVFGNAPYTFLWSTGATTTTVTGLAAGNYTVTVSDAINCTQMQNVTITQPSVLSLALTPTNISCSDLNNGTIELTVSGGTFPYSYVWSNNIFVEDQYNLGDGTYSVVVTDDNGCTATASALIDRPDTLLAAAVKTDVTCNGGNNGTITTTISGGIPPYSYLWSNNATTANLTGLSAGQYILTVTDANGCNNLQQLSVLIDEPLPVTVDSFFVECPVPGSGIANLIIYVSGGNGGPYNISVDSGSTYFMAGVDTIPVPVDSTYYLFALDQMGCVSPLGLSAYVNPEVAATLSYVLCFPLATTTTPVTVVPTGGQGGSYQVSFNGGNTYNAYGDYTDSLTVGASHTIIVRDSLGCVSVNYNINLPLPLQTLAGVDLAICTGTVANLNASGNGGTTPYAYLWSTGGTTASISVAPTITTSYTVTITDANGCTSSDVVVVTVNNLPVVSFSAADPDGCASHCTAFTPSGTGISYSWNFGFTTSTLTSPVICYPTPGVYDVILTVTDANGCINTATQVAAITVYPNPTAAFTASPQPTNMNNPTITFTDASTLGNTWQWDFGDGSAGSSVQNPSYTYSDPGTYTVTLVVTSANGCVDTIQVIVIIEDFPPLEMPEGISPNSDGLNDAFVIHGLGKYPDNHLTIFNRWGNIVYETHGYKNDWAGENKNGDKVPEGTYFVILDIPNADITLKGYVEIRY